MNAIANRLNYIQLLRKFAFVAKLLPHPIDADRLQREGEEGRNQLCG